MVSPQEGVGDTTDSFAYDGHRVRKWNVSTGKYGEVQISKNVLIVIFCTCNFYIKRKEEISDMLSLNVKLLTAQSRFIFYFFSFVKLRSVWWLYCFFFVFFCVFFYGYTVCCLNFLLVKFLLLHDCVAWKEL